jgi:hypothetical protein
VALLAATLAAGLLTRTGFVVIVVVVMAWLAWSLPRGLRGRVLAVVGSVSLLAVGGHVALRLGYYGDALPNTYALKLTGVSLATRVGRGLETGLRSWVIAFVAPAVVVVTAGARAGRARVRGAGLLVGMAGVLGAYSVWVGGDAWEWFLFANRYLAPGLVVFLVAGVTGADRIATQPGFASRRGVAPVASLVAVSLLGPLAGQAIDPTDSFRVSFPSAGVLLAFALVGAIGVAVVARLVVTHRTARTDVRSMLVVLALAPVVGLGIHPAYVLVTDGAPHVRDDRTMVGFGALIEEVTTPRARVAVVWAGAPAYYADRPTIDLLGKNDPVIARTPPHSDFTPGHDKWDYRYSIGRLRPDLVAQLWRPTKADLANLRAWGYVPVTPKRDADLSVPQVAEVSGHRVLLARRGSTALRWGRLDVRPWG